MKDRTEIPWNRLDIPEPMRNAIAPSSPKPLRLGAARATLPATPEATLGALYVLACDEDAEVRDTAVATLKTLPNVANAINQRTHPKVLELVASVRAEPALDEKILSVRAANDRTIILVATRAEEPLCVSIAENHERLLITPEVLVALHQNPNCPEAPLERAISFLRMQQSLPHLPPKRPKKGQPAAGAPPGAAPATAAPATPPPPAAAPPPPPPVFDLEAEIQAALEGKASPILQARKKLEMFEVERLDAPGDLAGFRFDFKDDDVFSLDLIEEVEGAEVAEGDDAVSIEKKVAAMTVGQKLKLAYLGNRTVRNLLIRDRNRMIASAVVKSGRLTDAEVLAHAGNRNLHDDVLREIATNREWTRKYPVKVALVNNPKCPPSVAVGMVPHLQARDLASLARNRNVSSVIFQMAGKLLKQKNV